MPFTLSTSGIIGKYFFSYSSTHYGQVDLLKQKFVYGCESFLLIFNILTENRFKNIANKQGVLMIIKCRASLKTRLFEADKF